MHTNKDRDNNLFVVVRVVSTFDVEACVVRVDPSLAVTVDVTVLVLVCCPNTTVVLKWSLPKSGCKLRSTKYMVRSLLSNSLKHTAKQASRDTSAIWVPDTTRHDTVHTWPQAEATACGRVDISH